MSGNNGLGCGGGGNNGSLADVVAGIGQSLGLGQSPEPFHGYGSSLDCEMMVGATDRSCWCRRTRWMEHSMGGAYHGVLW